MIPDDEPRIPLTAEEVEMKLQKVDVLEIKVTPHDVEIEIMKKRIKRLQDQKEDVK